ncbi:hypothetical protein K4K56_001929 [Colletotrichum sp. SAR 10_98]|nr:hypothetical protein K4K55_011868 [Colletotrichum sp. SAR 10_96]KAI8274057.1 hypothetical protein K4K56_001929 [Colletotrichum sp. SAR 10_98]
MVSQHVTESHDLAIGRDNFLKVERYPEGWARLAAEQDESVNIAIHRKFSYLGNRCLLYYEQKITRMEDQLLELDWQKQYSRILPATALLNEKAIAALYEVGDAEHKLRRPLRTYIQPIASAKATKFRPGA